MKTTAQNYCLQPHFRSVVKGKTTQFDVGKFLEKNNSLRHLFKLCNYDNFSRRLYIGLHKKSDITAKPDRTDRTGRFGSVYS